MPVTAKALAEANQGLEDAASLLKRTQNQTRRALQQVRQAQMQLKGVEVVEVDATQTPVREDTGYADSNTHSAR